MGVSKETFRSLFADGGDHDFAALDRIMPHPVYGKMYWMCVLNPSEATFERVKPLLTETYQASVAKRAKRGDAPLAARVLVSQIFLISGVMKLIDPAGTQHEMAERELGPIDVWVNNAMVSVFSPV